MGCPAAWIDPKAGFTKSSVLRFLMLKQTTQEASFINRTVFNEDCSCTFFLIAESWGSNADKHAWPDAGTCLPAKPHVTCDAVTSGCSFLL